MNSRPAPSPSAEAAEHFYPAAAFADLAQREARSFWFQSRNRILLSALARAAGNSPQRYAEIGCGTGFVLAAVAQRFPEWEVHGFDIHAAAVEFSRERAPRARVEVADVHHLPAQAEFDLVGIFDVLEHLDDDVAALRSIADHLTPGGRVVLTVPQHPSLWSPYDDAARHRLRYRRGQIRERLRCAGFRVEFLSSFVSTLWPLLWWRRRNLRRLPPAQAAASTREDLTPSPLFDVAGTLGMKPDEWAARLGLPLPWGGSLLAVARRAP